MLDKECKRFCGVCKQNHQRYNINLHAHCPYMNCWRSQIILRTPLKFLKLFRFIKWQEVSMKIIFVLLISFLWLMTMIHFLPSSTGKMTTQRFAVTKTYPLLFDVDRHVRFVKLSMLHWKRKKIGCNVSCVNNGFSRVTFRKNLLLKNVWSVNLFVKKIYRAILWLSVFSKYDVHSPRKVANTI